MTQSMLWLKKWQCPLHITLMTQENITISTIKTMEALCRCKTDRTMPSLINLKSCISNNALNWFNKAKTFKRNVTPLQTLTKVGALRILKLAYKLRANSYRHKNPLKRSNNSPKKVNQFHLITGLLSMKMSR